VRTAYGGEGFAKGNRSKNISHVKRANEGRQTIRDFSVSPQKTRGGLQFARQAREKKHKVKRTVFEGTVWKQISKEGGKEGVKSLKSSIIVILTKREEKGRKIKNSTASSQPCGRRLRGFEIRKRKVVVNSGDFLQRRYLLGSRSDCPPPNELNKRGGEFKTGGLILDQRGRFRARGIDAQAQAHGKDRSH